MDTLIQETVLCCFLYEDGTQCGQSSIGVLGRSFDDNTFACGDHMDFMRGGDNWAQLDDGRYFEPGVRP